MNETKVYDLPTRLFHWLFAGLFIGAFSIAKLIDDASPLFSQHMLLGLMLTFLTALRIIWGLMGSRYARFLSFPLNPLRLLEYFRDILSTKGNRHLAHNPASAWAALVMMGLALGLGTSGYLMSTGYKETLEEVHELLANAFIFVAIAHVAGVALHQLRHRDGIALSMFHGRKKSDAPNAGISSDHPFAAIILVGMMGVFAFQIYRNYDAAQSTTKLFGATIQLGENEAGEEGGESEEQDD